MLELIDGVGWLKLLFYCYYAHRTYQTWKIKKYLKDDVKHNIKPI